MLIFLRQFSFSIPYIFQTRNILLKQKMNLLFRNHRHGILWPFPNILFSFPFPQKHFSTGRLIQMKNSFRFKTDVFFWDQPFYKKKKQWGRSQWWEWNGTVCFGGVLYKTLSKMSYASSALCPADTCSPENMTCLPNVRHVAQWQCCPTSSPHTVMLPWEALFPLHDLKPEHIF